MEVIVIVKCTTCEHYNEMELGTPNFKPRQVEYESFTEAYEHMLAHEFGLHHMIMIGKTNEEISKT